MAEGFTPKTVEELMQHLALMNYQGKIKMIAVTFFDDKGEIQALTIGPDGGFVALLGAVTILQANMTRAIVEAHGRNPIPPAMMDE